MDPSKEPQDEVHFGATVQARTRTGNVHRFTIVGEDEADVATGKVSWLSPLAKALIGARVGDTVKWRRPAGEVELEILEIATSGQVTAEPVARPLSLAERAGVRGLLNRL